MTLGGFPVSPSTGPDPSGLCERGLQLQRAGRLDEAKAAYNAAVLMAPTDFQALYLLGLALIVSGEPEDGLRTIQRAILIQPGSAQAYFVMGIGQSALNRFEDAVASFSRGLSINPGVAKAHNDLGSALRNLGRHAEALQSFDRAIALDPRLAEAHYSRALALQAMGLMDPAMAGVDAALALRPEFAEAHLLRGTMLGALGRLHEAAATFEIVVALRPEWVAAHELRAVALTELGRLEEALVSRSSVVRLREGDSGAHLELGGVLARLGRFEEALVAYDRAIALDPLRADLYDVRGAALDRLGRFEEALVAYDRAIALDPTVAQPHTDKAHALWGLGRLEDALACYGRALEIDPNYRQAGFDRGLALLSLGRFEAGWRGHELRSTRAAPEMFAPARLWDGAEDVNGRRLWLPFEQGFGDTIQYSRYVAPLLERGALITLSVQPQLKTLMQRSWPGARVMGPDEWPADAELFCPLPSLPLAFGTALDSIPAPNRYLVPDEDGRARFASLLGARSRPRIGVAWSGNAAHADDAARSIGFEMFAGMIDDTHEWLALQAEVRPGDEPALGARPGVGRLDSLLETFDDTAAVVDLMDLVITVDTSLAHLAGALGKPVWILLPHVADWRWLRDRADSPWYPSARLFRQTARGDWAGVIAQVREALAERWAI